MQVILLAFAQARERLGFSERIVECTPHETPRQIVGRIAPQLDFNTCRVAVNQEYATWDTALDEPCEVALIPPVSGG